MNCKLFEVNNLVTVVTGAAQGIGKAIAERFGNAGADVVILDIADGGQDVADRIGARFIKTDVAKEEEYSDALASIAKESGQIDVLINNAAIQLYGTSIKDEDSELFDRIMRTNLNSVYFGMKHVERFVRDNGAIINTASTAGQMSMPGISAYGASKAAIIHLTKTAALELAPRGIRVNCVLPGITATPTLVDDPEEIAMRLARTFTPLGRAAHPAEIAALFHYLASPEAAYVTGQAYVIDGGASTGWSIQAIDKVLS